MMNNISPAAQVIVSIIPIVGLVLVFVLIFFALLWHHREVKLQIKNGTYAPFEFNWKAFTYLSGLSLVAVGIVLSLMFWAIKGLSWGLLGGLIPFAFGIVFLIFYKFLKNEK
ncbi:hypothetical protein MSI_19030 [Treponema sp. JC4]|uniref:hypothetical protein n=1 Tax=Treponema sp. JC4 TaxID=1124982 RepID=UPI00025B0E33|nr:hypothetical protein [Treponema sp. JC4]EID84613.1 hypothetical protein MSI_19030 [Treponema sp. JC4]